MDPARDLGVERQLTDALVRTFATGDPGVEVGIGDDGAVVRTTDRTVVACDPVIEDVHFTREAAPGDIGRKAVNRNLSDLAAMGAKPRYLLLALQQPDWMDAALRDAVFAGAHAAAQAAACAIVGGDVARSPSGLVLTVTALGEVESRPLLRSGLGPGDALLVTGALGGSGAGRHLTFEPRIAWGRALAACASVSAAIDVSDGLALDLATMLAASEAPGAELDAAAIPVAPAAAPDPRDGGHRGLWHALTDGEDHELLYGLRSEADPDEALGALPARARRRIGRVIDEPGLWLRRADGSRVRLQPEGYQHEL